MPSIFRAPSIDPAAVTAADLDAIRVEFGLAAADQAPADFYRPGATYAETSYPGDRPDVFSCAAVCLRADGSPIALGYAPVNLGGRRAWEMAFAGRREWKRGWAERPHLAPPALP